MDFDRRSVTLVAIAGTLFLISLALPALAVIEKPLLWGGPKEKVLPGITCLALGWILLPGWVANPLLLAASLLHGFRKHAIAIWLLSFAVISAVLAPFLLAHTDDPIKLRYAHVGYYVWLTSIVLMLASAIRSAARKRDLQLQL
jgi:hypothetical protein